MHQTNLLKLFWEGFEVAEHQILGEKRLLITLEACAAPRCSECDRTVMSIHDRHRRRLRERDLFDYRVWLEVTVRRVNCPRCGVRVEQFNTVRFACA